MFSDNCAGQNRNRFVAFTLNFSRAHFDLKTINHTFLEKGLSETENDSVHATIERKARNNEIYSPQQWFAVVRSARSSEQPYIVCEMTSGDFTSKVRNLNMDDSGNKIFWSKVRQVVSKADDPSALYIKTSYNSQPQRLDLNRRKRTSGGADDAANVKLLHRMSKPGISELKKHDLMTLCSSGQIPVGYREFYEALPIG